MLVEDFRELRVYQNGYKAAMCIFELSKQWPSGEQFSLIDQIRRCSRSVCTNVAEAWGKRRYVSHFVSKLSDTDTEAQETRSWLDFALGCGYITKELFADLENEYRVISGGVIKMMAAPERWYGPSALRIREEGTTYDVDS